MPGPGSVACPKPPRGSQKRARRARRRSETAVIQEVRPQVVLRDGYCRVRKYGLEPVLGPCRGESQWAHLERYRKCHTRGMDAEERHTTHGTAMFCDGHHDAYDAHEFSVLSADWTVGANAALTYVTKAQTVEEVHV